MSANVDIYIERMARGLQDASEQLPDPADCREALIAEAIYLSAANLLYAMAAVNGEGK